MSHCLVHLMVCASFITYKASSVQHRVCYNLMYIILVTEISYQFLPTMHILFSFMISL